MNNLNLKPWQYSFALHASLVAMFIIMSLIQFDPDSMVDVPIVIEESKEVQNLTEMKENSKVVLKSVNEPEVNKPTREIFGANRNSYTDSSLGSEGVEAKKGNTLAKEADNEKLLDSDADSLPTPTEEYLVSEMPSVLVEVKPIYPKEAREKQIQGDVVLDILIDDQGIVRSAQFIEGAEIFKLVAVDAMKKFKFKPAKVDGKSVAVKIRYRLKFELEY